jgi:hypothetical protein
MAPQAELGRDRTRDRKASLEAQVIRDLVAVDLLDALEADLAEH